MKRTTRRTAFGVSVVVMGKGGTKFSGDAVGVRNKAVGYSGKDMRKVGMFGRARREGGGWDASPVVVGGQR